VPNPRYNQPSWILSNKTHDAGGLCLIPPARK